MQEFSANDEVLLVKAQPEHIPLITQLTDEEFGEGYMTEGLESKLSDPDAIFRVAFNRQGEFMGYCYTIIITAAEVSALYRIMSLPGEINRNAPIGVLKTVATVKAHRRKGVGTALAGDALRALREKGVQACMTLAWESKEGINILGVVNRHHFEIHEKIPDFWYNDSLKKKYNCPSCGQPPCRCAAIVYSLMLEQPQQQKAAAINTIKRDVAQQPKRANEKAWWKFW